MKPVTIRAALAGCLLALGIAAAQAAPADLMTADRAFSKMAAAKGQGYALLAFVANDGRLFGTGEEPPVVGRAQAFRHLARRKRGLLRRTPRTARVSADGTLGWTDGTWLFSAAKGAKPRAAGYYLTVWSKGRGGWKIQADMDVPAPAVKK